MCCLFDVTPYCQSTSGSRVTVRSVTLATHIAYSMAAHDTLRDIRELEELKKDTAVTRSVKASTQRLLTLDRNEEMFMEGLVTKLRKAYNEMLLSVQHCRLVATRREKLWVLFHQFSVGQALNLSAPETFWQLLMEKEFLRSLILSEQAHCGASIPLLKRPLIQPLITG